MVTITQIHESFIYDATIGQPVYTREYYQYIIHLLTTILTRRPDLQINAMVGNDPIYHFANARKTVIIRINYEHTLVRSGGRDSHHGVPGNVRGEDGSYHYLVRIADYERLMTADIVIDYSIPNLINIKTSGCFDEFFPKCVYIAPMLHAIAPMNAMTLKTIQCVTTFVNPDEPRRRRLLLNLARHNIDHVNINTIFDRPSLEALYHKTKVLINIHQTPHHHTFEELRVLPALCSGVIVISEHSPLHTHVPYHRFVIWTTYENILPTLTDVLTNYDGYHGEIFCQEWMDTCARLQQENHESLQRRLDDLLTNDDGLPLP